MKLLLDTHTFLWFIAGDSQLSYQARQLVVRGYLMSRSRKKRPFSSITTAKTEKQEKRLANRRVRRVNKSLLAGTHDETQLRRKREVSNVWCMSKDGKQRFDPVVYPELMRK